MAFKIVTLQANLYYGYSPHFRITVKSSNYDTKCKYDQKRFHNKSKPSYIKSLLS